MIALRTSGIETAFAGQPERAAPVKVTTFEYLFGLFAVLTYQGAFFPAIRASTASKDPSVAVLEGDPLARGAQLLILFTLLILVVLRRKTLYPALRLGIPYAGIILIAAMSTLWSQLPFVTFRRSMALMSCFVFGYYAYAVYGPRNLIRILATASVIASIGSLIVIAAIPSIGIEEAEFLNVGAAKGVFSQKNELSVNILIGLCNCIYLAFIAPNRTRFDRSFIYFLPPILVLLMLSRGETSIISFGVVLIATFSFFTQRNPRLAITVLASAGALGLILVTIAAVDVDILFKSLGKDATFTGRWPLWVECVKAIGARPFLGYGYAAFWDPNENLTRYIWSRAGWMAPSAHNGFLQLALDIGVIGMSFYLYLIVRLAVLTVRAVRLGNVGEARWLSLFLIAMLIENLDEGTLAWPDLMASQVAFGTALTESWWLQYRKSKARSGTSTRFPTWSERFAGKGALHPSGIGPSGIGAEPA